MLQLQIKFESSWSNSFYQEPGGEPLFTSGSELAASAKGLTPVPFDRQEALRDGSRLSYLQALQRANPSLLYRVPEGFDRTVQGVLARLVGEVRRLSDVGDDHLALRAFAKGRFVMSIEHEHSQTTKLTTYEVNDIQTGGAGLISNVALYSGSDRCKYLFGHLGLSLPDLQASLKELLSNNQTTHLQWFPSSPAALMDRLRTLDAEQDEAIKSARKMADEGAYTTPYLQTFNDLAGFLFQESQATVAKQALMSQQGKKKVSLTIDSGAMDGWSIAGAVIAARIALLSAEDRAAFIDEGALTKAGGLAGLAMTGAVGRVTPKDMFKFATGLKAQSNRMPYAIDIPVAQADGRKQFVPSGILKKTGTVTFEIDNDAGIERELFDAINNASVGPFHFGKKGVAYVQRLDLY